MEYNFCLEPCHIQLGYRYDYPVDEFGVQKENKEEILWNAEDYDQQNPLYTDKNGMYMWDVPAGQWLVKFSKDGYFDTDSRKDTAADSDGYLPVPPPQTEVNTAIVSKAAPTVENMNAYTDEVQIIFSQYMNIESANTDNVKVFVNGEQISGTISPSDAECDYKKENQYARIFTFIPNTALSGEVSITVKNVKNYNGKAIESEYREKKDASLKPSEIAVNDTINIKYGSGALAEIAILPEKAGKNKTLTVSSASPSIAEVVNSSVVTDGEGKIGVMLSGILPGEAEITVKLDGTNITKTFKAVVENTEDTGNKCEKVTASIESGSTVEKGTKVELKTTTEGADIYYTTDGTCPCTLGSASRIKYNAPIEINGYTFIIAYAVKDGMEDSNTRGFIYNVSEKVKTPAASPKGGSVSNGTKVSLSCDTENAVIYYTTDGKIPSAASVKYTAPINVNKAMTIKAVAVKDGMTNSDIMSESYTISTSGGSSGGGGGGGGSTSRGGFAPAIPNTENNSAENNGMKFTDVSESDWFCNAVKFAFEKGITSGVSDTEYAPQGKVTRAQFITMLCRAYNIPEMTGDNFADCGDTWYTGYLAAAKQMGISNGVGDNMFAPDKEITREEMVALIYNYLKSVGEINGESDKTSFADDSDISDWAKAAVAYAAENGIVNGKDENKFDPKGNATRAELAQIFFNILKTE